MAQIVIDSNSNLIQGDFDSATVNNRTKFQTSTVNANTGVYAVPNGTGTVAGFQAANNSNPTNASKIVMATNGSTDTQIISGVNGSGTYLPLSFYTNNALGMQLDTSGNLSVTGTGSISGNLSFNSGYGSSAVAYGCRAWVNFNGTGTVAIRGSGNISSITDNGTGDYTLNFTTAMPDANYNLVGTTGTAGNQEDVITVGFKDATTVPTTTSARINVATRGFVNTDQDRVSVTIFR